MEDRRAEGIRSCVLEHLPSRDLTALLQLLMSPSHTPHGVASIVHPIVQWGKLRNREGSDLSKVSQGASGQIWESNPAPEVSAPSSPHCSSDSLLGKAQAHCPLPCGMWV